MNTINEEIINLKKSLLKMFFLVENQWEKGQTAVIKHDQDMAAEIAFSEARINAQELKIDNDCENIIALHTPVAIDLRFVLAAYKINHSLERIADIAESIANYVAINNNQYPKEVLVELRLNEMFENFNSMMDNVISAFENEDTIAARKIFRKDKILNEINSQANSKIINYLEKYDKDMLLLLLSTVRKIERAGDSIKKIGEEIIFHIEAKVVKHQIK
jgi:phosphate transport system protein